MFGKITPATPDGRLAGEPLADGISPLQQMDTNGPTAVLSSVSKINQVKYPNGTLLNMKFHPSALQSEQGIKKLSELISTYFDLGGMEVQINVVKMCIRDSPYIVKIHLSRCHMPLHRFTRFIPCWSCLLYTSSGIETWTGWIMPCVSMALGTIAMLARQMRSDMLEVLRQDYITTARAKGLPEKKVVYRHALKNALIPVITIVGGMFGASLGGSLITEVIFSIPGMGQYIMTGLNNRDYPVIQSGILILSTLFSLIILVVDVLLSLIHI